MDRKRIIQNFKDLFTNRIWSVDTENASRLKQRLVRDVKILRVTFTTFQENRMGFQCVALAYFVSLAIIPLAALVFAVCGGLNVADRIEVLLMRFAPQNPEFITVIVEKARNIIDVAQSGWVGAVSAIFFLWTILWLMFQAERVFNNIWGIRRIPRKMYKRFGFYLLLLMLIPLMMLVFAGGFAIYSNILTVVGFSFMDLAFIVKFVAYAALLGIVVFTFYLMYRYIPATQVQKDIALKSAVIAAVIFLVFQFLYLKTQIFVTRLDAVYGALAAIPLFLIWLNISWQIIMYGAQLSYSFQHIEHYKTQI